MIKKTTLSNQLKLGLIYLNVGLISIFLLISTLYIYNLGKKAQMGYSFTVQERKHNDLQNTHEKLKLQLLEASSLDQIINKNHKILLMQPTQPEYLESRHQRLSHLP